MNTTQQNIIDVLKKSKDSLSLAQIISNAKLTQSDSSVQRAVKNLIDEQLVERIGKGKNTTYKYSSINEYLDIPFFSRPEKRYNPSFLDSYVPGKTFFLSVDERKKLLEVNNVETLDTLFLTKNQKLYEKLLIDLSYSSSYLEGNTYSYLDTEVLIKYNQEADGKKMEDTQMILNHKKAFEFLIGIKNMDDAFTLNTLSQVHELLLTNLLPDQYLGIIRSLPVKIGGSSYIPLEDGVFLKNEILIFLEKLKNIPDPFEQALFTLIFIPYFQIFTDGNKRTSRLFCNISLIQHGLVPFSFLTIDKKEFLKGLLTVYERNNVEYIKKVFLDSYFRAVKLYF